MVKTKRKTTYKKTFTFKKDKNLKFNESISTLIASSPYLTKKRKTQLIKEWLKK